MGQKLRELIEAAKSVNPAVSFSNEVKLLEAATKSAPEKGFHIESIRTGAKGKERFRYPAPWEFHKALNEGIASIPNKDAKNFAMLKLFTGIRNTDIMRIEILPENEADRVPNKNYYDPSVKKVRIFNKGGGMTDIDLGHIANTVLQEQAESAMTANPPRTTIFPLEGVTELELEKSGKALANSYGTEINKHINTALDNHDISIWDKKEQKKKPFTLGALRKNLFDVIEESLGKDVASEMLGHKGDYVMGDHYTVDRTARRRDLGKLRPADIFSKIFLEDILYDVDEVGRVQIPIDQGMTPKAFLIELGYNSAKSLPDESLVEESPLIRKAQKAAEVVGMTKEQVTRQINNFNQAMENMLKLIEGTYASVERKVSQLTKLLDDYSKLRTTRGEELRAITERKLADMRESLQVIKEGTNLPEGLRPTADGTFDYDKRGNMLLDFYEGLSPSAKRKIGGAALAALTSSLAGPAGAAKFAAETVGEEVLLQTIAPSSLQGVDLEPMSDDQVLRMLAEGRDDVNLHSGPYETTLPEEVRRREQESQEIADIPTNQMRPKWAREHLAEYRPKMEQAFLERDITDVTSLGGEPRAIPERKLNPDKFRIESLEEAMEAEEGDLMKEYEGFIKSDPRRSDSRFREMLKDNPSFLNI